MSVMHPAAKQCGVYRPHLERWTAASGDEFEEAEDRNRCTADTNSPSADLTRHLEPGPGAFGHLDKRRKSLAESVISLKSLQEDLHPPKCLALDFR